MASREWDVANTRRDEVQAQGAARQTQEGAVESAHHYIIVGPRRRPASSDIRGAIDHEHGSDGVSSREAAKLPPPLMTVEELAVLLHTSNGAVYARHARGGIPGSIRLGRTLRFDPRVIAQWISANSASAGGQS